MDVADEGTVPTRHTPGLPAADARSSPARQASVIRRWATAVTAAIAAGALFPQAPLRDAVTLRPASDVTLSVPPVFLVFSPVCRVLDALMLLGLRQHYAVLSTVVIGVLAWRLARRLRGRSDRACRATTLLCWVLPAAILGVYAACLWPVPLVLALRVADPDDVVVDFHSHTNASWDARKWFTVEHNRSWHRAAGWNVAYITDHTTLAGADPGTAANPRRAGDDTILLPAVETRRTHLVALGVTTEDREKLQRSHGKRRVPYDQRHAVIQVIPASLERFPRSEQTEIGPLVGIELSDADPRGLDEEQRERAALLEIADRRNLAVVASSNNHGWTSTPVAWSLLRIPGWRDLAPRTLDLEIQGRLRSDGRRAVRIVERYGADVRPSAIGLVATVPAVVWHILATLTPGEQLSWLAWSWAAAYLASRRARSAANRL